MENNTTNTGLNGKTIAGTIGFGVLTLATMLLSSIISDKFVNNGTQVIEGIQTKMAAKKEKK